MTLRATYAPILPEFDAFLFASVGEEVDGVPLSVLSALSRLGLDPWDEAARLAHLTREAAADQLARMITRLHDTRWSAPEAWKLASGLIDRLPPARATAKVERIIPAARPTTVFATTFLVYVAMAFAMLVSLLAGGFLSLGG